MAKKGLGKGLESLIPKKQTTISTKNKTQSSGSDNVLISKIKPNPHQPRQDMDKTALNELANSIKEHGVIQPLIVSKSDSGYELLAGERRLRASKIAGLSKVPVVVRSVTDQQKLEVAIIENVQRKDLNPIEEAQSYKRLMDEFNLSQEEIAKKMGKSRSAIANILRILNLPDKIQKAIKAGKISLGHAKAIMSVDDESQQLKIFDRIIAGNLTVRDTEKGIKKSKKYSGKVSVKTSQVVGYEEVLRQSLGTKVEIKNTGKRGKILIDYYSDSELKDIIDKISS